MIDEGGFAIYLSESDREGRATWSIVTYDSRMQSNQHKQQIRLRIYVVKSSRIMEWTFLWLSSVNKAAEMLSVTATRWFDARDDFEEFDNFFDDTFLATTLFANPIPSLLFCSDQQLRNQRNQWEILVNVLKDRTIAEKVALVLISLARRLTGLFHVLWYHRARPLVISGYTSWKKRRRTLSFHPY